MAYHLLLFVSSRFFSVISLLLVLMSLTGCSQLINQANHSDNSTPAAPSSAGTPADPASSPQLPTGSNSAASPATSTDDPLTTYLLNKPANGSPYDGQTLTLVFAVTGGSVTRTINDFRFLCKRENEDKFSTCPDSYQYTFDNLQSGSSYSLTVKAVSVSTNETSKPDSVKFTVK